MSKNNNTKTIDGKTVDSIRTTAGTLADTFGKISLPPELRKFQASLQANLIVTYHVGASQPTVVFKLPDGKMVPMTTIAALSGFRSHVAKLVKDFEETSASKEKVKLISKLREVAAVALPQVMARGNNTRIMTLVKLTDRLRENMEGLATLPNPGVLHPLLSLKGKILENLLFREMEHCLSNRERTEEELLQSIMDHGVPVWLYNQMCKLKPNFRAMTNESAWLYPAKFEDGFGLTIPEMMNSMFISKNLPMVASDFTMIHIMKKVFGTIEVPRGRDAKAAQASYYRTKVYALVSKLGVEETLDQQKGRSPKYAGAGYNGIDSEGVISRNAHLLGSLAFYWASIGSFQIALENPFKFFKDLGVDVSDWETKNSYLNEAYENYDSSMEDHYKELRAPTTTASKGLMLAHMMCAMKRTHDEDFSKVLQEALTMGEEAMCLDIVGSTNTIHLMGVKPDGTVGAESDKMVLKDSKPKKFMEAFLTSNQIEQWNGLFANSSDYNDTLEKTKWKLHDVDDAEEKKVKAFLNLREKAKKDAETRVVLASDVDEPTKVVLDKIKHVKYGSDILEGVLEWITVTFYDQPKVQYQAAQAILGALNNAQIDLLTEAEDE